MKTFILMTKLAPEAAARMKEREQMGQDWLEQVTTKCPEVKFLAHYALLGNYDFMACLLYTSPSPRDRTRSRMPSSA